MFITKKLINDNDYFYLRESRRIDGKVKAITLKYLGKTKVEAVINAEKFKKKFIDKKNAKDFKPSSQEFIMKENNVAKNIENNFIDKNVIENKYDKLMELASKKSLFYPAAEIYPNSPAGFWDFGPIGASIKRKLVEFWRKELVEKEDFLEISGSQILPESVFVGSGHLKSFADPIVQCLKCKKFERADKIISQKINENVPESLPIEKLDDLISKHKIKCPKCNGDFGKVSKFNMMVETIVGKSGEFRTFLRPEACQSIFLNFSRMSKTMRLKLPGGIAQVGGVFRNEISPRQSITRAVEFSQMDCEIFFDPDKINDVENFDSVENYKVRILRLGKDIIEEFSTKDLVEKRIVPGKLIAYYLARTQDVWHKMGIPLDKIRFREVDKDERAFYSLATFDFEVETSIGWLELIANNYRTDYDLKGHSENSGTKLDYVYEGGLRVTPHIWEISAGVDRTLYAILEHSLKVGKEGLYLSLIPKLAPFVCAVLPLVKKDGISELAYKIHNDFKNSWLDSFYDESGSIGRRYARADEVGIPFCLTIDYNSLKNDDVTIRFRDSGEQKRVKIKDLKTVIAELLSK